MILNEFFNNPKLDEGAEFGSYYSEELAQKVFDLNPNLSTAGRADELLDAAWPIAVEDLGKKSAQYKFSYDEDFPSDFVSMYAQLQKQGVSEASRGKYHANTTGFTRGARDDERHDLDQERAQIEKSGTWYIRLNGKLIRDKQGTPYTYRDKAAANKAAVTMQAKLFNQGKEFVLTTNPNDKSQGMSEMWGNPYDDDKVDAINAANPPKISGTGTKPVVPAKNIAPAPRQANTLDHDAWDKFTRGVAEVQGQPLTVQQLATVSDAALDKAYGYGRSQPGNSFGWQANLKSAAFAKQMIDKGVTDIEAISDAIHKGWNTTAQAFVQNPEQFDDTAKLKAAGKLEAKLQQRAQLMKQNYGQLPEEEKEKDRVVARALLQALKGGQDVEEGYVPINKYNGPSSTSYITKPKSDGIGSRLLNKAKEKINTMKGLDPSGHKIQSYEWNSKDNTKNLPPEIYWQDQYVKVTNYDIPQAQNVSKNKVDTDYYVKHATKIKELLASHGIEVPDIEDRSAISNWEPIRLQQGMAEADYGSDYQAMVKRVGQMAKQGERKTVWDPVKRVYKTVPVTQSKEQGVAEGVAETIPWKEAQTVLNHYGADYFGTSYDKLYFYKYRKRFSIGLIRDEDGNGNHSVNLSELNDMVRKLRGMRVPLSPFEEGMAEADMSRRGFLKGLGAAAVAGAAGGAMAQSTQQQDLGNGFVLTTIDVAGHTVKAVLDTQTGLSFTLNRGSNGSAIIRSQARFLTIKDGKIVDTSMSVGPATTTAMKKAGLVQEGVAEGLDDNVPADRGEYDQEGEMAQQDLTTAVAAAEELRSILSADENLPEWVQAKITKAVDYLDTTRDYMKSKEPELNESRLHRLNLLKTILIQTP